jgi:type I restriction enzyme S subunit
MVHLGEVLRHVPRPITPKLDTPYREIGIRSHGRGIFHKSPVTAADIGAKRVFGIDPGDFVLNIVFAWEGAVAVVSDAETGMIASHRFPTFLPDPLRLDVRYLVLYFRTRSGLDLLGRVSPGGAGRNRTLSRTAFLEQPIPLPPLPEQCRIAAKLDQVLANLAQVSGLRQSAVEATRRLATNMAHRSDIDDAERTHLGWRRAPLSDLIQLVADRHRVEATQRYQNLGIYSFGRGLFPKPPIDGGLTSAPFLHKVKTRQFIYSRLFAFEGAYGMVTEEFDGFFVSQEYPTFECNPHSVRAEFLWAYFRSPRVWREVAAGSKGLGDRRQRVQPPQVLGREIWLPPMTWQNRIAETLDHSTRLEREHAATGTEIDALVAAILDRAFKGEL